MTRDAVAVRLCAGEELAAMPVESLIARVLDEVAARRWGGIARTGLLQHIKD